MRIKSKIKDYYDYVAYRYGGGDPKIMYKRGKIENDIDVSKYNLEKLPYTPTKLKNDYSFSWLGCCGKKYLLVRFRKSGSFFDAWSKWQILNEKKHALLCEVLKKRFNDFYMIGQAKRDGVNSFYDYLGSESKAILKISRDIKSPVFLINAHGVDNTVPNLSELGMPALICAEQMYQNIAHYMSNDMSLSPDKNPPVEVSDRYKIEQHGFDKRVSFRHRLNQ